MPTCKRRNSSSSTRSDLHTLDPNYPSARRANRRRAALCGLLRRHWHRIMGMSPGEYHAMHQMQRAQEQLAHTSLSITYIANGLGYADPLYFSRKFRKQVGMSPSAYREKFGEK